MGIGTFGSFTQARLAIYASQTGLTVTGNNISNVNTQGYTRQRLNQKSLYNAGTDRYYSTTGVKVGQGVLCYGLSQLRDPYLDIQYRSKSAQVGAMDALLEGLNRIAGVLDEVGKGGEIPEGKEFGIIAAQFREVYDALNNLTSETGHDEYDVQVRSACQTLTNFLRSYSRGLEEQYNNTVNMFENNVDTVNTILTNIRNLNENIRQADIFGDDALEMRDERNLLIDQLSEYIKIDVSYSMEKVGVGAEIEKLTIKLDNANPDASVHTDETVLVDGIYASQLSIDAVLNKAAYKYVEADGKTLTNNPARAAVQDPWKNPNFGLKDANDPAYDDNYPGVDVEFVKMVDGKITAAADEADAGVKPNNPDYDPTQEGLLYLKADGKTATAVYEEAAHDPNFNITVSELKDRNGRVLFTLGKPTETTITEKEFNDAGGKATTEVDPATGVVTITTYIKQLSDKITRNAQWNKGSTTAYRYLTASGAGTNSADEAAKTYWLNPDYGKPADPQNPNQETGRYFVIKKDADGNPELDADGKYQIEGSTDDPDMAVIPKGNASYCPGEVSGYRYVRYDKYGTTPPKLPDDPAKATEDEIKALQEYYTNDLNEARGDPTYIKQVYEKVPSTQVKLDDNDLYGKLQSQRELLTEAGEFSDKETVANVDENAVTKRGIPYFQKSLDLLAHTLATEMNKANQGYLVNPEGEYIDPTKDDGSTLTFTNPNDAKETYTLNKNVKWEDIPSWVKAPEDVAAGIKAGPLAGVKSVAEYLAQPRTDVNGDPLKDADGNVILNGAFRGGNLFSNNGDTNSDDPPITAGNISISLDWASGPMVVNSFVCPTGSSEPASSDSDNIINNLTSLFYRKLEFRPNTVPYEGMGEVREDAMFVGTLEDMWINMGNVLGNDMSIASKELDNAYDSQVSIDTSRDSVSAVDFNDEAMNLMMYAKAYNAACRMMTTLDSVLDKLINNTGMTT